MVPGYILCIEVIFYRSIVYSIVLIHLEFNILYEFQSIYPCALLMLFIALFKRFSFELSASSFKTLNTDQMPILKQITNANQNMEICFSLSCSKSQLYKGLAFHWLFCVWIMLHDFVLSILTKIHFAVNLQLICLLLLSAYKLKYFEQVSDCKSPPGY